VQDHARITEKVLYVTKNLSRSRNLKRLSSIYTT